MRWNRVILGVLALAACAGVAGPAAAKEKSQAQVELQNLGVLPEAEGKVKFKLSSRKAKLDVKVKDLEPNTGYILTSNGMEVARFDTDRRGKAKLKFEAPPRARGRSLPMDFDPRGTLLAVNDGAQDVLASVLSGALEPAGSKVKEETSLTPTAGFVGGFAEAEFEVKRGVKKFEVKLKRVPPGDYDLFVGGVMRGTITVSSRGKGEIEFKNPPGDHPLLDFEPRGELVEVFSGPDLAFSGTLRADVPPGATVCTPSETRLDLGTTPDTPPGGSGDVKFEVKDDCDEQLSVEIEDVPLGDYDVAVGGTVRGTLTVIFQDGRNKGEIDFDTDPDDPNEVPLTFDPRGQTVQVLQGATVLFEVTLP